MCIKLTHKRSYMAAHIHLTKSLYKNCKKGHSVHSNVDDHAYRTPPWTFQLSEKRTFCFWYTIYFQCTVFNIYFEVVLGNKFAECNCNMSLVSKNKIITICFYRFSFIHLQHKKVHFSFFLGLRLLVCPHFFLRQLWARGCSLA